MNRFTDYLCISSPYAAGMKGLHWSPNGDAIEFREGGTFAFPGEIFPFLEGFSSQRPLIHFAHILHLLHLLKEKHTPSLGRQEEVLPRAFALAQRPYRNAGVFCALLCVDIPATPDPVELLPFWTGTFELEVGASEPLFTLQEGEMPPLAPEVFEARILFALSAYSFEDILHWLRHGRGPVRKEAEEIAETVLLDKPRSLHGVLAELAQSQRLSGAVPFVEQFVSALTLPPRRLEHSELPLGGYSDVTTHGQIEQILPSQLAYEDLEFIRRYAERELLFFHREDPHIHTRQELLVLLDQGVRVWGTVRLVLTAALLALGRLSEHRRLPFLIAATSDGGAVHDPLQAPATELQELIECSDLSPHPAAALECVLSEEIALARDLVLLTHPRNLSEPQVMAALRRLPAGHRLFAVAVDDCGSVQFSELRGGVPVPLSRFQVDLERTAPPPVMPVVDPQTAWRGAVEPVPFPFRFGTNVDGRPIHFAFDAAGDWLLVASPGGMLHAARTDGSCSEILPRGLVQNTIVAGVSQVIGVAGGFVVISYPSGQVHALHYDFTTRTCTAHVFARESDAPVPKCFYLRLLHTLVVDKRPKPECLQLSTGSRERPPAAFENLDSRLWAYPLPIQGKGEPISTESHWRWPQMIFGSAGRIRLENVMPVWDDFTPMADNQPALKGCKLEHADCQNNTLAALFTNPHKPSGPATLHLFWGPQGVPLTTFRQQPNARRFTLSMDGRLLVREIDRGQVEIRDVFSSNTPRLLRWKGRFHPHEQIRVRLGERRLLIQNPNHDHLILWKATNLILIHRNVANGKYRMEDAHFSASPHEVVAQPGRVPEFLPPDPGERFTKAAWNNLIAVVDRFGEVALFEQSGNLVCMFFAFRQQIAVWMPDGTCHGPTALLGRPATPHALEKIGEALRVAWERGERG